MPPSMSKDHIFDMVLRHQSIPNRKRRKRSQFILKPPDFILGHVEGNTQEESHFEGKDNRRK